MYIVSRNVWHTLLDTPPDIASQTGHWQAVATHLITATRHFIVLGARCALYDRFSRETHPSAYTAVEVVMPNSGSVAPSSGRLPVLVSCDVRGATVHTFRSVRAYTIMR